MRGNLGPRDDIEALIYLMFYLMNGKLPWSQNLPVMSDELNDHMELQRVIHQLRDPEILCRDIESEFQIILTYL